MLDVPRLDAELRATERLVSGVHRELVNERVAFSEFVSEQQQGSDALVHGVREEAARAQRAAREWEERAVAAETELQMLNQQAEAAARREEGRIAQRLAGQRKALQLEARRSHTETVAESLKICKNKDHNRGLYKNGVMQEIVMPADASAALIEGSGSFMLHLAFWLSIQFFVEPTRGEFYCFVQHASDGSWYRGPDTQSFLNQSLLEL